MVHSDICQFGELSLLIKTFGGNQSCLTYNYSLHCRNFFKRNARNIFLTGKCFEMFRMFVSLCSWICAEVAQNCHVCTFGSDLRFHLCNFSCAWIASLLTCQTKVILIAKLQIYWVATRFCGFVNHAWKSANHQSTQFFKVSAKIPFPPSHSHGSFFSSSTQ